MPAILTLIIAAMVLVPVLLLLSPLLYVAANGAHALGGRPAAATASPRREPSDSPLAQRVRAHRTSSHRSAPTPIHHTA